MATQAQRRAAKRNVEKAVSAAQKKRTIASMPKATRSALGKQASAVARRKRTGAAGPRPQELYDEARRRGIPGRSEMGRAELARALGQS